MDFRQLEYDFKSNIFRNEDDIKLHFHSDIVKPILKEVNPTMIHQYRSEEVLRAGGRTDATFQVISFEFKKEDRFSSDAGIKEALYGRDEKDHGLYDYIISNSGITEMDDELSVVKKLSTGIGIGFDGKQFIFARFISSSQKKHINVSKVSINIPEPINLTFF